MKPYINAYRVLDLSAWDLQTMKDLGFQGIRFDVTDPNDVGPSCEVLSSYGLEGLLLLNGGDMPLDEPETVHLVEAVVPLAFGPVALEIGNEPDISTRYERDWDGFGRLVNAAAVTCGGRLPVVSGGLFSTSKEGLEYLGYALRWMDPSVMVGVHSYRQEGPPDTPKRWFANRRDELDAIRTTAGGRPVWCTETGWHTAPFKVGWRRKKQWNDDQVASFLAQELRFNALGDHRICTIYQWTDGPSDEGIDNFGMKVFNEQVLKPQAQCVKMAALEEPYQ